MTAAAFRRLPITLVVAGPVISRSSAEPAFGLDASQLRTGDCPVLPGAQIRGLLREVFARAEATGSPAVNSGWIATWFGAPSADHRRSDESSSAAYEPKAGRLVFEDFFAPPSGRADGRITRIRVDPATGAVEEGMLHSVEALWNWGEEVWFAGGLLIDGDASDTEIASLKRRLDWGFKLIPAVGAHRTAGFGRLLRVEIDSAEATANDAPADLNGLVGAAGTSIALHPKAPFLVNAEGFGGNFFAGAAEIPGAVLKALAARKLRALGRYGEYEALLSRLIFRHARPEPDDGRRRPRPRAIPQSLFAVFEDKKVEAVGDDLLGGAGEFLEWPIAFQGDWKGGDLSASPADAGEPVSIRDAYGWTEPPRRIARTRTAASEEGVAEDQQLFSHAAVDPNGYVWRAEILLPDPVEDRNEAAALLALLEGEMLGLGKSKVRVAWSAEPLEVAHADPVEPISRADGKATWRLVLETPALLQSQATIDGAMRASDPRKRMILIYGDYFQGVLAEWARKNGQDAPAKGAVEVQFRATQRLAGGYIALRYPPHDGGYVPWLLTEAGSTFHVTTPEAFDGFFAAVARTGLPLPADLGDSRRDWRGCPWVPENGWGEARVRRSDPWADGRIVGTSA